RQADRHSPSQDWFRLSTLQSFSDADGGGKPAPRGTHSGQRRRRSGSSPRNTADVASGGQDASQAARAFRRRAATRRAGPSGREPSRNRAGGRADRQSRFG